MSNPPPPTPDPLYVLRGAKSPVTAVSSYRHLLLVTGTQDGIIQVWDLKTRRVICECQHSQDDQSILAIMCADDDIVSHGRDGTLKVWKYNGEEIINSGSFTCHSGSFFPMDLEITEKGAVAIVPGPASSEVDLVNISSNRVTSKMLVQHCGEKGYGLCMCGKIVISEVIVGYENGNVVLWDASESSASELSKLACHKETVTALDYCEKYNRGISGSVDNKLAVWSISDGKDLKELKTLTLTNPGVNVIKVRQDSKIFAVGCWDHKVRIFGVKKLQPLAVLSLHQDGISGIAFSSDLIMLVSSRDRTVSAWSLYR